MASIIGRIEDEQLWPHLNYGSTLAYATHELDIDVERFMVLKNLWAMVKEMLPTQEWSSKITIILSEWAVLKVTYALKIQRLHHALKSGDPSTCRRKIREAFDAALLAKSAEDLGRKIDGDLDRQTFMRWTVSIPPEVAGVAEEAILKALRAGGAADPETLAKSRRGRHVGFEIVVRTFVVGGASDALPEALEAAVTKALPFVGDSDDPRAAALDVIGRFFLTKFSGEP